jgi:hypothetical protein
MRSGKQSVRRAASAAWLAILVLVGAPRAGATPGQDYSDVYHAAVAFLRSTPADSWLVEEGRGVALAEAVPADRFVVGPRSTAFLSSLDLDSVDALARRVRALAGLDLDVSRDVESLVAEISQLRPNRIALDPILRDSERTKVGAAGHRVPIELDNALVVRALYEAGVTGSDPLDGDAVQDALLYLLEFQLADGSWPLVRDGEAGGSGPAGDILATAEVVRALLPYRDFTFTYETADAQALGINMDVGAAIDAAVVFLKGATYDNAVDRAVSLLAYLEGALDSADPEVSTAHLQLVSMGQSSDGTFGDSALAAALAAQALLKAAELPGFAFDWDGDGLGDGPDPDSDDDDACDPGESGGCSGVDAFPLDESEQLDSDNDGIGDLADPDSDGDGLCDLGETGSSCSGQDAFPTDPTEHADSDGDGIGSVVDTDDDNDGVSDVEEQIAGLNPEDVDTDGDSFLDPVELAAGTDGADPNTFPLPDGDIFPLGSADGVTDIRDALLALRIVGSSVFVGPPDEAVFYLHADVAPLVNGVPSPDGSFGLGDVLVILRWVNDLVSL